MLWNGEEKVSLLRFGHEAVSVLWLGGVKIWEAVSSCFGSGFWRTNYPWKCRDAWK